MHECDAWSNMRALHSVTYAQIQRQMHGHWHEHRHNHNITHKYTLVIQCTRALDIRFHLISTMQRRDVHGTYTQHKNVDDDDNDDALHWCACPYFFFALMFNCWLGTLFDATSVAVLLAFVVYVQNSLQFKSNFLCRFDNFKIRFFIEKMFHIQN